MIDHNPRRGELPPHLPPGSTLWQITFASRTESSQWLAVELGEDAPPPVEAASVGSAPDFVLLNVFTDASQSQAGEDAPLLSGLRSWVEGEQPLPEQQSLLMTFQGVQVLLAPGRCAILAPQERLHALNRTVVEFACNEAALCAVEARVDETWTELEGDVPLAFEFDNSALGKRKQLRLRFEQTLLARAQLARIGPYVRSPHRHPATLADQLGERLRERTRLVHRYEAVGEQLEVFERVYELSGQRAADFMLARSGNALEWIIIVLLLAQTMMTAFEILASS